MLFAVISILSDRWYRCWHVWHPRKDKNHLCRSRFVSLSPFLGKPFTAKQHHQTQGLSTSCERGRPGKAAWNFCTCRDAQMPADHREHQQASCSSCLGKAGALLHSELLAHSLSSSRSCSKICACDYSVCWSSRGLKSGFDNWVIYS